MDQEGEIILSCAPYWAHPNTNSGPNDIPWRDHWIQAIYYLPKEINLHKNEIFNLNSNHNEYLLWFKEKDMQVCKSSEPPACRESFFIVNSRTRIGQLNDHIRNKKYLRILEEIITKDSIVFGISDGSLLTLSCCQLKAKQVIILQENRFHRDVIQSYIDYNKLTNVKIIKSMDDLDCIEDITHIIGEPYFMKSILPWDNLYFGTLITKIQSQLNKNVIILPKCGKIYGIPVEFLNLHKIRAPLDYCEGFNMKKFDDMIDVS